MRQSFLKSQGQQIGCICKALHDMLFKPMGDPVISQKKMNNHSGAQRRQPGASHDIKLMLLSEQTTHRSQVIAVEAT